MAFGYPNPDKKNYILLDLPYNRSAQGKILFSLHIEKINSFDILLCDNASLNIYLKTACPRNVINY